jgi:hypothetical protein
VRDRPRPLRRIDEGVGEQDGHSTRFSGPQIRVERVAEAPAMA